jgi:hypothetical protein
MPNSHRKNTIMSNSSANGKNSMTFENVVCSQLELKRRAASFSRRRSTMCRRQSIYVPTIIPSSNKIRTSISEIPDISTQFLKTNNSNNDGKRSRTSSINSVNGTGLESIAEQQSLVSMLYWDSSIPRNINNKKV